MRIIPKEIVYLKSKEAKYGTLHDFRMTVIDEEGNELKGYYSTNDKGFNAKDKTQNKFTEGVECEAEVHEMSKDGKTWYRFKPEQKAGFSKYNQALRKEQARYASFSYSYTKDLIVAGKLDIAKWHEAAQKAAKGMMEIDKDLEK